MKNYIVIVMCLTIAGCANAPPLGQAPAGMPQSNVEIAKPGELPPPDREDLIDQGRTSLIGPFDKLNIEVLGLEEFKQEDIQTDAGGRISFPLAGTIEAAGMTPQEVAALIEERLKARFIRDPHVTVNLKDTVSQVVTIDGEVKEPGLYPVVGRMTLMRAVASAKGASEFAKLQDVVVFRTVKGKQMAALYDLKAIRRGFYEDPQVYPNDIVVVGDSAARRIFKDALLIAPILTTPLILLLQNRN